MARPLTQIDWAAVDGAIDTGVPAALATLAELVAEESTLGNEASSQRIVRRELERLGFEVEEVEIDPRISLPIPPRASRASTTRAGPC